MGDLAPLALQDYEGYLARKAPLESWASQELQEKVYVCKIFTFPLGRVLYSKQICPNCPPFDPSPFPSSPQKNPFL